MPQPPSDRNLFDVLRFGLAAAVVYSHAHLMGGYGAEAFGLWTRGQTIAGSLAVLGFFGVSGFLVTRSFCSRQAAVAFVQARLLRILPGFYFSLLVAAFVLAPLIARLNPQAGDWQWTAAWSFLQRNALVRVGEWHVGDVLRGLPYVGSLNGSLWSLFPECLCYGLVLGLGLLGCFGGRRASLYVWTLLLATMHVVLKVAPDQAALMAPTFLRLTGWTPYFLAFFVGACVYVSRDELMLGWPGAVLWGAITAILLRFGGWNLAGPITLPLFILNLAYSGRWRLHVDLSYGLYVIHFPVLQLLAATSLRQQAFGWFFAAGMGISALIATVTWYLVEEPFLRLKRKN